MRIPVVSGKIRRRLLINYRADPELVARVLPEPFRPKIYRGHAILGICLIRLEEMRPTGLPSALGLSSENAAHRFAVEWESDGSMHQGVYVPRRDTNSLLNRLAGGRLFPGEQHAADFEVTDDGAQVDLSMRSADGEVSVRIKGEDASALPAGSCFASAAEASEFFEAGDLGYSATRNGGRFDGLRLHTDAWRARPFAVSEAQSSYFSDPSRFPAGSVEFDHALIMRDIPHEWRDAQDLRAS